MYFMYMYEGLLGFGQFFITYDVNSFFIRLYWILDWETPVKHETKM